MIEALTPAQVAERRLLQHSAKIDAYVERVNNYLLNNASAATTATGVPFEYRQEVAARFQLAGWRVDYNCDRNCYSDWFKIEAPKGDGGPYR